MTLNTVAVTVDLVLLTIRSSELHVLLIRRAIPPFEGHWALPGGFVLPDEDLDDAAARELHEEAGLRPGHFEQLATYGTPGRDPRGRVITVAYLALLPDQPVPVAGSDAAAASWLPVTPGPALAFDHARILADGLERASAKLEYTPLATAFCPPEFTIGQVREVYEIVWGTRLDPANFHRKVTGVPGFLIPTGGRSAGTGGRPAALYRAGPATRLHPAILREHAA